MEPVMQIYPNPSKRMRGNSWQYRSSRCVHLDDSSRKDLLLPRVADITFIIRALSKKNALAGIFRCSAATLNARLVFPRRSDWATDEHQIVSKDTHLPCQACHSPIDLVYGSESMHTWVFKCCKARKSVRQTQDRQCKSIRPAQRKVLNVHFFVGICLSLTPQKQTFFGR
jgi:hypothetical protein